MVFAAFTGAFVFRRGQALAWRQLKDRGIYVATNPSSSFFYVLTASHAFHLVGGVTPCPAWVSGPCSWAAAAP
jgi:cytochrome c oxidase subunit 3